MLPSVLWAIVANSGNPKRGSLEPLIYSWLVRSTGGDQRLGLASEMDGEGEEQSWGTEPLTPGMRSYLQVDGGVEKTEPHVWWPEVSEAKCVWVVEKMHRRHMGGKLSLSNPVTMDKSLKLCVPGFSFVNWGIIKVFTSWGCLRISSPQKSVWYIVSAM